MLNKFVFFTFSTLLVTSHVFPVHASPLTWEQKYADESSLDFLLERTVELHKDWLTQFNQLGIK